MFTRSTAKSSSASTSEDEIHNTLQNQRTRDDEGTPVLCSRSYNEKYFARRPERMHAPPPPHVPNPHMRRLHSSGPETASANSAPKPN